MGLEAINYTYSGSSDVRDLLKSYGALFKNTSGTHSVIKGNDFYIETEIENDSYFYIRVTLCNPVESVLRELDAFFDYLLNKNKGKLKDLNSKKEYLQYTIEESQEIRLSYLNKKAIFNQMYGEYTAPIGTEEFYRRISK